jgi:hypothetical protein
VHGGFLESGFNALERIDSENAKLTKTFRSHNPHSHPQLVAHLADNFDSVLIGSGLHQLFALPEDQHLQSGLGVAGL